jgi:Tol biopolymer transport system component
MARTYHLGALAAAVGVLLAVGLLILLALEVGPAEATFPGKPGKIAFAGSDGTDYEIYTIKAGGGGKVQLTDNSTSDYDPSYSPSGKKIAFQGYDGQDYEIYTINVGGGGRVQLTDNSTSDYDPSYSPSGKKITYAGDNNGQDYEIRTINVGGGGRVQLTDNSGNEHDPSWGSTQ